jgi:hypothetical protein
MILSVTISIDIASKPNQGTRQTSVLGKTVGRVVDSINCIFELRVVTTQGTLSLCAITNLTKDYSI